MRTTYIVYPVGADDMEKEKYANNGLDPEVFLARRIAEQLSGATVCNDEKRHKHEILIGKTRRTETARALASLKANQYGVFCFGERVAVCGHCVAATIKAVELLLSCDFQLLTDGFSLVETYEGWIVDFPRFDGGKYLGMSDCSHDRVEWVWSGVTKPALEEYRTLLEAKGYALAFQNERDGNRFYRLIQGTHFLQLGYLRATHTLRVISGSLEKTGVVDEWASLPSLDAPITLTQMALDYIGGSFGMCYIMTLEDGSFVIMDGGQVRVAGGYPKTFDYLRLYMLLCELNKRPDGEIVISAWLMTHEHADHFNVFYWFCRFCHDFGRRVTVKRYCDCSCSDAVSFNSKNPDYPTTRGRLDKAREWIGGFDTVTLHTGDIMRFGELSFEVLYTVDDLFPERLHYFNDSSFVLRMNYRGQTTMWLGDICTEPSQFLRKHWRPKTLKSDIVQLAHHGLNGAEIELYELIGGRVFLWSLRDRLVKDNNENPTLPHHFIGRQMYYEMNAEEIILHTRHNDTLPLPYEVGKSERIKR